MMVAVGVGVIVGNGVCVIVEVGDIVGVIVGVIVAVLVFEGRNGVRLGSPGLSTSPILATLSSDGFVLSPGRLQADKTTISRTLSNIDVRINQPKNHCLIMSA
jgi:hypothetical protein